MKNKIEILSILVLLVISVPGLKAQKLFLTPTLGIKADVNSNKNYLGPVNEGAYFQYSSTRIKSNGLSPLLLGVNLEYEKSKNIFGLGLIIGDQANSETKITYYRNDNNPYYNNKSRITYSNYAGWNFAAKIPLIYKREIFSLNSKKIPEHKRLAINFNTGLNLLFLKTKNRPQLINPISWGKSITDFGDTVEFVGYAGQMNSTLSVSFNLGFDFDYYVKGNRRVVAQLYFEQGTRLISNSFYGMFLNNEFNGLGGSTSRGSAINFKLAFPINIYNKR